MKNLLIYLLGLSILFLSLMSCDEDSTSQIDDPILTDDIVDIAVKNSDFSALVEAATKAGLVETLKGDGPFTVFAPTDVAFRSLLETIGQESLDKVPAEVIAKILKYHVLSGAVPSSSVTAGQIDALEGGKLTLATDGVITVNGAKVVNADIMATNGIIHVIDAVLVPESELTFVNSVLEPAYFSEDFTTLISAAVKADLVTTILEQDAITIFAPTNEAFEAAGIDGTEDASTLADVLKYHVVLATAKAADVPSLGGSVNSFLEKPILAIEEKVSTSYYKLWFSTPEAGGVYVNGAKVIAADLVADSKPGAVVHVIDAVLQIPNNTTVEVAVGNSDFSSLVAALQRSENEEGGQNLISILNNDTYTIFAPTNDAFAAFLESLGEGTQLGDVPLATLEEVLLYHVVEGRAYSSDLAEAVDEAGMLETAQGSDLTFDLTNLQIDDLGPGDKSNITKVNLNSSNGVIHVIDKVLDPRD